MALNQLKVIEVKNLPLRIYFVLRITDKVLYIMRDIFWHIFCRFDKFRAKQIFQGIQLLGYQQEHL